MSTDDIIPLPLETYPNDKHIDVDDDDEAPALIAATTEPQNGGGIDDDVNNNHDNTKKSTSADLPPCPLTILSGFLGSGKVRTFVWG